MAYTIYRFYADHREPRVIQEGLSLEEAQAHCSDPETSSRTAIDDREPGDWFDGYRGDA